MLISKSEAISKIWVIKTPQTSYIYCLVLWNPWIEKSKSMSDFDDEEVLTVCVEYLFKQSLVSKDDLFRVWTC